MFQKEKEMEKEMEKETEIEEETSSPNKWRISRDSPEQRITFSFAGVRGKCCSRATQRIFGLEIFDQDSAEPNLAWIRPLMEAI